METIEEDRNQLSKRIRIDETLGYTHEEEDRISALPDCILLHILSLLPSTKDVIRTGKLSKRWKSLWTSIPNLVFIQHQRTVDIVPFVNKTLSQCRLSKLVKFQVEMKYSYRFESDVNNWIRYAINRNVEQLHFNFGYYNRSGWDECVLEDQFFVSSCFTDLHLNGIVFNPKGAINWKMLRSLCISQAILDEDLIQNILSGSPSLESLELRFCDGYKQLHITSKSLKNLMFFGYDNYFDLEAVIEIKAPYIKSLKILNILEWVKLLLVDVSSLEEVELNYRKVGVPGHRSSRQKKAGEAMLSEFLGKLRHVKELKVGNKCTKALFNLEATGFPFPSNMKLFETPPSYSDSDSLDIKNPYDSDEDSSDSDSE